jgi:hypothetical protein
MGDSLMPEELSSTLLQGLETGLSMQDVLLSQIDTSDPTMALVARMLAARSAESNSKSEEDSEPQPDELTQHRLQRLSRAVRKLQHDCDSLRTETEELQLRNDTLAAALGACYLCWGEYPGCEVCSGEGTPGRFPVNAQAFTEFVMPAIRAFKANQPPAAQRAEVECKSIQ